MLNNRGKVPAAAEMAFLERVKWLDLYGADLHPVLVSQILNSLSLSLSIRRAIIILHSFQTTHLSYNSSFTLILSSHDQLSPSSRFSKTSFENSLFTSSFFSL